MVRPIDLGMLSNKATDDPRMKNIRQGKFVSFEHCPDFSLVSNLGSCQNEKCKKEFAIVCYRAKGVYFRRFCGDCGGIQEIKDL